jgi:hypothetical protein
MTHHNWHVMPVRVVLGSGDWRAVHEASGDVRPLPNLSFS